MLRAQDVPEYDSYRANLLQNWEACGREFRSWIVHMSFIEGAYT